MCALVVVLSAGAQDYVLKPNGNHKAMKEDSQNVYRAEDISTLDLLQALESLGVKISKFKLPQTDRERQLGVTTDQYAKGKLIASDTMWLGKNTYVYWERGDTAVYKDFLDDITLITKHTKQDSTMLVQVKTYSMVFGIPVKYKPERKDSFYNVRTFLQGKFQYGEKMPLIAVASSWYDPQIGMTRFCGKAVLEKGEADTRELLEQSPDYYIISYILK